MSDYARPYGPWSEQLEAGVAPCETLTDVFPDELRLERNGTKGEGSPAAGDTDLTRVVAMVEGSRLHAGGLAALLTSLSTAIAVVSTVRELDKCHREIERHRPDMAIFEVRRVRPELVRFLRVLHERHGAIRLVAIVGSMEQRGTQQLLALGLSGLLSADLAPADLLAALNAIRSGGVVVDPVAMSNALNGPPDEALALTAWEIRILRLAAQGLHNGEMARQLSISQSTLKRNFRLIFDKLGAKDRTSALVAAIRTGLI